MKRRLEIRVKPNAKISTLEEQPDGSWVAKVKAPPIEGRANEALRILVSEHFGIRRSQITIRAGAASRLKLLEISEE